MAKQKFSFKSEEEVVNFGTYKCSNITIGQLIKTDPEYITWCLKNWKNFKLYKKLQELYLETLKNKTCQN
jgi:hypothetical protein